MRIPLLPLALLVPILFGGTAGAKDLPRREPERQSSGCEWAGPGFAKLPGTETCIKVGGAVRAEGSVSIGR